MEINDEYIIEKYSNKQIKTIDKCDKEYLQTRFNDSLSIKESLYRILHNIIVRPCCHVCGKPVLFIGKTNKIFAAYCSVSCSRKDSKVIEKCKITSISLYGSYGNRTKYKETCMYKYGVVNTFAIPEISNAIKINNKSCKEEALQKRKLTCLERYGTEEMLASPKVREKIENTMLAKYGEKYSMKIDSIKSKYNYSLISSKGCESKRKNGTFNTSKSEDESYNILLEKYSDIIRQYKSEQYPFNCDFYIPSLNLYIECQYGWTHGGHPFNENNLNDVNILNKWKEKQTRYYNNAIITWTKRDVKKREIAKQNNLNYLEFWNMQELVKWVNNC